MCLPLHQLKCFVKFNAMIAVLLGLASFICAIVVNVKASDSGWFNYDTGFDYYGLMCCLYIFGTALMVIGACGFIGGKKKSKILLLIFDIGMSIGFIIFFSMAIAACVLTSSVNKGNVSLSKISNN